MNALIGAWNDLGARWQAWAIHSTWQGLIAAALMVGLLAVWRRSTPAFRCPLLLLVLLKFVLPPIGAAPFGLFSQLRSRVSSSGRAVEPSDVGDASLSPAAPERMPDESNGSDIDGKAGGLPRVNGAISAPKAPPVPLPAPEDDNRPVAAPRAPLTPPAWGLLVQIAGSVLLGIFVLLQSRALSRKRTRGRHVSEGCLLELAELARERLGLRRLPVLALSSDVESPQAGGCLSPFALLPDWIEKKDEGEQRALIAHELAHLRRGDPWINALQVAAQIVLWWDPAVWLLNRRIRAERELCCDDAVLAAGLADGEGYSRLLVDVAERWSRAQLALEGIGLVDSFRSIQTRVRRALDPRQKRPARLSLAAVSGLFVLAAIVLPGAPLARQTESLQPAAASKSESSVAAGQSEKPVAPRPPAPQATPRDEALEAARPRVVSLFPEDGAKDVETNAAIRIRFDKPMSPMAVYLMWKEGSFVRNEIPQYDAGRREFTIPVQLEAGTTHRIGFTGSPGLEKGFESADDVAAENFEWSFATRGTPVSTTGLKPQVVSVEPPSGTTVTLDMTLRVRFDRPMDPWHYGFKELESTHSVDWERLSVRDRVAYDAGNREFALPLRLPRDWNGRLELHDFRSGEGVIADPTVVEYHAGRNAYAGDERKRFEGNQQSADLRSFMQQAVEARRNLKSLSETVQWVSRVGYDQDGFNVLYSWRTAFKMQGDRQFHEDGGNISPITVAGDGETCWMQLLGFGQLVACPHDEVQRKNVLIGEIFQPRGGGPGGAIERLDWEAKIKRSNLEYLGQVMLGDRKCHLVRSWSENQQWWIDAETFLPLKMEQDDGAESMVFVYDRINQPIPDSEFRLPASSEVEVQKPEPLDAGYTTRFLNVMDGNSGMSIRWGKYGPKAGWSSSGLN